jgi:hypothetical protein
VAVQYPGTVKVFTPKVDFADTILAEHVNTLQDEVNAIEANLGTYIKTGSGWIGSFDQVTTAWPTLKDRIANIEYGLNSVFVSRIPTGGTTGQVLVKSSGTDYDFTWSTFSALPSQTGHANQYLTTDGTTASWAAAETTVSPLLLIGA